MKLDPEDIEAISRKVFDILWDRQISKVMDVLLHNGVHVRREGDNMIASPPEAVTPCMETILIVWRDDILAWLWAHEVDGI